jgi:hypothetical protein
VLLHTLSFAPFALFAEHFSVTDYNLISTQKQKWIIIGMKRIKIKKKPIGVAAEAWRG